MIRLLCHGFDKLYANTISSSLMHVYLITIHFQLISISIFNSSRCNRSEKAPRGAL